MKIRDNLLFNSTHHDELIARKVILKLLIVISNFNAFINNE